MLIPRLRKQERTAADVARIGIDWGEVEPLIERSYRLGEPLVRSLLTCAARCQGPAHPGR